MMVANGEWHVLLPHSNRCFFRIADPPEEEQRARFGVADGEEEGAVSDELGGFCTAGVAALSGLTKHCAALIYVALASAQ